MLIRKYEKYNIKMRMKMKGRSTNSQDKQIIKRENRQIKDKIKTK